MRVDPATVAFLCFLLPTLSCRADSTPIKLKPVIEVACGVMVYTCPTWLGKEAIIRAPDNCHQKTSYTSIRFVSDVSGRVISWAPDGVDSNYRLMDGGVLIREILNQWKVEWYNRQYNVWVATKEVRICDF